MKRFLLYSIGIIFIFILWIVLSITFGAVIVPTPWQAVRRLVELCSSPSIWYHLLVTYVRTIIGFTLAFFVGALIGIATGRIQTLEKSFFFPVSLLQGAPPLIWIIPLMLILGTTGGAPVAVVFFVVLPIVIINISEGVKTIDRESLDMFRIYANSRTLIVRELFFPRIGSHVKSIFLTGFLIALKSSILGEWFGAHDGIGRVTNEYFYSFDMPSFYAISLLYLLSLGIVALLLGKLTGFFFERRPSKISNGEQAKSSINHRTRGSELVIEDVSFSYGKKLILDRISFSLRDSKITVLTGDSGVGKTTFARLATGLLVPQKGKIALPDNACLIFQEDVLLPHLDCFGNAALPARKKKTADTASRTLLALERCGLGECAHIFPDELSGGMKKRLAFARALVSDPDFIILDEPFNKLHKEGRDELWELFFALFAGRGIPSIIITHFPEELTRFGYYDRVLLSKGKLVTLED